MYKLWSYKYIQLCTQQVTFIHSFQPEVNSIYNGEPQKHKNCQQARMFLSLRSKSMYKGKKESEVHEFERLNMTNYSWFIICLEHLTGEGNGNPLQYSCLENPMDRGAWWAAVHGSQKVGHDWATSLHFNCLIKILIFCPLMGIKFCGEVTHLFLVMVRLQEAFFGNNLLNTTTQNKQSLENLSEDTTQSWTWLSNFTLS